MVLLLTLFLGATGTAADQAAADPSAGVAFDAEAAVNAYLARLSPEERARSDAYFEGGYWLQLWDVLWTLGVAWLLLGTRLSARMRDSAQRWTRFRPLQTTLYAVQYIILTTLLGFPLTVFQGFLREHRYGLATQSFAPWIGEQAISLGVALVMAPLLLIPLYGVFRRAPRTWWLWGAMLAVAFLVLSIVISPVYIDPLFNTYEPLAEGPLKESILSLARTSDIEVDNIYQFDASRQSTRISANVSGFLGTMSIRLNDNLLNRCSPAEVRAVMAHEIGHYVLNHVFELLLFFSIVAVTGFAVLRWAFDRLVARCGQHWRVSGIDDPAGLPLLVAILALFFFVLTPLTNGFSRAIETEADLYSLHAAREPDGFAEVALKLSEYRKIDPGPVEEWLFYDHPSGRTRITMAMRFKAEQLRAAETGRRGSEQTPARDLSTAGDPEADEAGADP